MTEVRVTFSGPLFDGRAQAAMPDIVDAVSGALGAEGQRRVLAGLDTTLRQPTGAYRRRIALYGPVGGQARVHDNRGIYGPWLEGVGSRNRTTRFKGYHNFRTATQVLQRAAKPLAEHVIAQHIHKLGG
jgi:hypothetical protein